VNLRHPSAVQNLTKAWAQSGFCKVAGHGVSNPLVQAAFRQADEMLLTKCPQSAISEAFGPNGKYIFDETTNGTRDWRECIKWNRCAADSHTNDSPIGKLVSEMNVLGTLLRRLFSECLGAHPHVLDEAFENPDSELRISKYSGDPSGAKTQGVGGHTDATFLTLVIRNTPGLEVLYEGDWIDVGHWHEDEIVVNVGELGQIWSNDRFESPIHRVENPSGPDAAFSALYFMQPSLRAPIVKLPEDESVYEPLTWGDYRVRKFGSEDGAFSSTEGMQETILDSFRLPDKKRAVAASQ